MRLTKEQIKAIPGLLKSGEGIRSIAHAFGCHRQSIQRRVAVLKRTGGVKPPKLGRPFKK